MKESCPSCKVEIVHHRVPNCPRCNGVLVDPYEETTRLRTALTESRREVEAMKMTREIAIQDAARHQAENATLRQEVNALKAETGRLVREQDQRWEAMKLRAESAEAESRREVMAQMKSYEAQVAALVLDKKNAISIAKELLDAAEGVKNQAIREKEAALAENATLRRQVEELRVSEKPNAERIFDIGFETGLGERNDNDQRCQHLIAQRDDFKRQVEEQEGRVLRANSYSATLSVERDALQRQVEEQAAKLAEAERVRDLAAKEHRRLLDMLRAPEDDFEKASARIEQAEALNATLTAELTGAKNRYCALAIVSESKESKLASEATRLEAALRALEKAANAVVEWAAERWGGVEPIAIRELRAALASPTPSVGEETSCCSLRAKCDRHSKGCEAGDGSRKEAEKEKNR